MFRRGVQVLLLCIVTVIMLGAGESRFDRLGHRMMCICGCNQILLECNHVGCTDSTRMIGELRDQLAAGGSDRSIENWFVAKYGAIVLAAPSRGGFDDVAWIMPIAVFLLATMGTGLVVWMWRRRWLRLAGSSGIAGDFVPLAEIDAADAALRERIRRETEYR